MMGFWCFSRAFLSQQILGSERQPARTLPYYVPSVRQKQQILVVFSRPSVPFCPRKTTDIGCFLVPFCAFLSDKNNRYWLFSRAFVASFFD